MNVAFMSYVQGGCHIKIQINVFGKSQDYNTVTQGLGKRQRAESRLKEVLEKN